MRNITCQMVVMLCSW